MATKKATRQRSIEQFVKDRKRSTCPVCALPDNARKQLRVARERKYPRSDVLAWLAEDYNVKISDADMTHHVGGRHDA